MSAISLGALGVAIKRLNNSNLTPVVPNYPSPLQLSPSSTGGTLASGTYAYRATYLIGSTETAACPEVTVTAPSGGAASIVVTVPPLPGAQAKIYGRTSGSELLLTTLSSGVWTYTDTGSATPSGALPGSSGFSEPSLYTVPSSTISQVSELLVSNPTAVRTVVFLGVTPSGGSATRVIGGVPVLPDAMRGAPVRFPLDLPLAAGDQVTGYSTVPGVSMLLKGSEVGA